MESLNLYSPCQHGFRKNRSCVTQLLEVMEHFTSYYEQRITFDVIYLDFSKAFDTVPHQRLLSKMNAYGFGPKFLQWTKSFLQDRTQQVRIGKELSNVSKVTSGIPQGSVLGPVLFTIFINDLPECVNGLCKIFADDTKVYNTCDNHNILQNDLLSLQHWSNTWQLLFNNDKCKCIQYGKNNPKHSYHFDTQKGTQEIKVDSEEKDLGVIFDSSLKFDLHINSIVNKANKILGLIKRNFNYIDSGIFIKLFKALVRPHLEYANVIWHPAYKYHQIMLENIQRRATKMDKRD